MAGRFSPSGRPHPPSFDRRETFAMTSRMTLMGTVGPIGRGGWTSALCRRPSGRAWPGILALTTAVLLVAAPTKAAAEPKAAPRREIDQRLLEARQGFQAAVHAELELVRCTCGSLAKASRPAIVAAAGQGLERAAKEFVDRQLAGRGGQGFDARQHVYDAIVPVLEPLVSAEEFAAYQREHAARIARRVRAARLQLMDGLTTTLDLSAAQAAAIEADLRERWHPDWLVQLDGNGPLIVNGLRLAPDFAAEAITPRLDERQQAAWEDWCLAVESDIRRLADDLKAARAKFDRTIIEIDRPHAESQRSVVEFQRVMQQLTERRRALLGRDSLLAKSLPTTLDADQLARLSADTAARRVRRWQVIVASYLDGIDTWLGLDQRQYDEIERLLLEKQPPLRVDEAVFISLAQQQQAEQVLAILVMSEIDGQRLQATLRERQWKALSPWREQGARLRSHVEGAGILEQVPE
jgi:hypothetical protein